MFMFSKSTCIKTWTDYQYKNYLMWIFNKSYIALINLYIAST